MIAPRLQRIREAVPEREIVRLLEPRFLAGGPVPGTTNRLEGGTNSPIRRILLNHRGMSEAHMMRVYE